MDIRGTLKKSVLFKNWNDVDLDRVVEVAKTRELNPGETLFFESDPSTSFFVVVKGTLHVKKASNNGDDENVTDIGTGAHIGELGMLDKEKRSASAEAVEACHILEVDYGAFDKVLEKNPIGAHFFYKNLAAHLARQIRRTTEDLASVRALRLKHV